MSKKVRLVFATALFLSLPLTILAAEVKIAPQNSVIKEGEQIIIDINIDNVSNLFGAAFDLVFDPNVLSFVLAEKGNFLEKDGKSATFLATVNPANTLVIAYSRLAVSGTPTGIGGNGTLAKLTFQAKKSGISSLVFKNNALCDAASALSCNKIAADWHNGSIIINSNDSTPPLTPENIIATSSLIVELEWNPSVDINSDSSQVSGLAGYKIYKNGVLIATTTNNFYIDENVTPDTFYTYAVSAYDAANNESSKNVITVTTPPPIDDKPPVRFNAFPKGSLPYFTTQTSLSLSTDENANCKYSTSANMAYSSMNNMFSITGAKYHSQTISNLTSGAFRYYVKCEDKAGNYNNDDYIIEFLIDNPPVIVAPPDTLAPTMPNNIKATSSLNVSLSWKLPAASKPATGYRIFRNGEQIATTNQDYYLDTKLSPSKKYIYTVSAYDENNNTSNLSEPVKSGLLTKIYNAITFNSSNLKDLKGPFVIGMRSEEVKKLQKMLAQDSEVYPEGLITGYYGYLTVRAVQKFQKKYGIIDYGNPQTTGYGLAGPKTRDKLNELYGQFAAEENNKAITGGLLAVLSTLVGVAFFKFIV